MHSPLLKAWIATAVFSVAGLAGLVYLAPRTPEITPHVLFYAVLVINTFYSVRFYSRIQPHTISQHVVDGALILTYIALGLSIGRPVEFAAAVLLLFAIAPVKYALMLGRIPYARLLRRKISVDVFGTASCLTLFFATLAGYALIAAWIFAAGFALANTYLLIIRPMYRFRAGD